MLEKEIRRGCDCICDSAAREAQAAELVGRAKARVQSGHWVVETQGRVETFNAAEKAANFRPARWMTAAGCATVRSLNRLPVGGEFSLETGFHPRHGLKTQLFKRIA